MFAPHSSSAEAMHFLRGLHSLLVHIGSCSARGEEGALRCDVNVSVEGPAPLGLRSRRCEVKNVNGVRAAGQAVEVEALRQIQALLDGQEVLNETLRLDVARGVTVRMRGKESALDYRFFPDPDLPPLRLSQAMLQSWRESLPELPAQMVERFHRKMGLSVGAAHTLVSVRHAPLFFEQACQSLDTGTSSPTKATKELHQQVANWMLNEMFARAKRESEDESVDLDAVHITPKQLASLVVAVQQEDISGKIGKQVIREMFAGDNRLAMEIVDSKGWRQVSDEALLQSICRQVVEQNPGEVEKLRAGRDRVFGYLVGQVMKATKGKANPDRVNQLLREQLEAAVHQEGEEGRRG